MDDPLAADRELCWQPGVRAVHGGCERVSRSGRRLVALLTAAALVAGVSAFTATPVVAVDPIVVNSLGDGAATDGRYTFREAIVAANSDTSSGGGATGECLATAGTNTITFSVAGTITALAGWQAISATVTIDGGGAVTLSGGGTHRLLVVTAGSVTVAGLTLRDGSSFEGSAIAVSGGSLTVNDSTFLSNDASDVGGAIEFLSPSGNLVIANSTFTGNTAATEGGAIYKTGTGSVTISGSTFADNTITGPDSVGGGLSIHGVTVSVSSSTFTGNSQAAAFFQTVATVTDSLVANNTGQVCAGLFARGAGLTVLRTTIRDNAATAVGGGVCSASFDVSKSNLTISRSTISGNTAPAGAGVQVTEGTTTIANTTIADNVATDDGGGLRAGGFIDNATLNLYNVTITRNSAATSGGVALPNDVFGEIVNALIVGNTNGDLQLDGSNVGFTTDASITVGSAAGILDPRGLRANGGPTKTVALLPTATSAIGQGNALVCASKFVGNVDQRGRSRQVDACDIGAVERETIAPSAPTAPTIGLRTGVRLDGSSSRVRLAWDGGADDVDGVGFDHFTVQRSVDGGAFSTIASPTAKAFDTTLAKDHTYRFRVASVDHDDNVSPFSSAPTVTARLFQQSSSRVTFRGTWSTSSRSSFSRGSARWSGTRSSSASFTATGRSFAWITTVGPSRGKAKLYVDGVLVRTIDLRADSTSFRRQAFVRTFPTAGTHTIRIVVLSTSGRPRVDVDAFTVLK